MDLCLGYFPSLFEEIIRLILFALAKINLAEQAVEACISCVKAKRIFDRRRQCCEIRSSGGIVQIARNLVDQSIDIQRI
jgi:hypothetical protein